MALLIGFGQAANAQPGAFGETDRPNAPIDLGAGIGRLLEPGFKPALAGTAQAHVTGSFGAPFTWPIIPIHAALLPDGRVIGYGSDKNGNQGAKLFYTVWDPTAAPDAAFLTLDNTTGTDLFCNTQVLLPGSGELLMLGGDRTDAWGRRNYGNADVDRFDWRTNILSKDAQPMAARRWYASVVTTSTGEQVVLGGRDSRSASAGPGDAPPTTNTYSPTPEAYSATAGWRLLSGATSNAAYGPTGASWYYPRAWVAPSGKLFLLGHPGDMYALDPSGSGALSAFTARTSAANYSLPAAMFAPGKILSLRDKTTAVVVDIRGAQPTVAATNPPSVLRRWGSATVLADGQVWVNGGSVTDNSTADAAYHTELWSPTTGQWTRTASAAKARLYHSTSLLLPDATVLTAGGGAPGPVKQLNGEIFYPPYLFKRDGSGQFATRPAIVSAPDRTVNWGETVGITTSLLKKAKRVTLVRTGAVTHAFNNEQRFMDLSFTQAGPLLSVTLPTDKALAPPGFYLLFVFDKDGVPSVGRILSLGG